MKATIHAMLLLLLPLSIHAGNGVDVLGFGPRSIGMGSADLTLVDDSTTLQINPASLSLIERPRLDLYLLDSRSFDSRHRDGFGNDIQSIVTGGNFLSAGLAIPLDATLVWAAGFNVLGGTGVEIQGLKTAFGTVDEVSSLTSVIGFSTGLSWKRDRRNALGISITINYFRNEQRFLPNTSFSQAGQTFFGQQIQDATGVGYAVRLGWLHHLDRDTVLGLAYKSRSALDANDGQLTLDMTAIGLGKVGYRQLSLSGIDQPQEIGLGLSHRLNPRWRFAVEIDWLNWRRAARRSHLSASGPDNPFAPSRVDFSLPLDWKDQYVFAFGLDYRFRDGDEFLMGLNLANNPVPRQNMSPTLSAIATRHVTAGFIHHAGINHTVSLAAEYQLKAQASYTNPALPFGNATFIEFDNFILHLLYAYRW